MIGWILIFTAAAGMVICLVGLAAVWRAKAPLTTYITSQLDLTLTTLEATNQGLDSTSQSLEMASASLTTLQITVETMGKSIEDTTPLVESLTTLLGEDLPNTLATAQTSLGTAEASAGIIDQVLRLVTSIPFMPGEPYNPPVPLNVALGQVADSLENLPESFSDMKDSLETTQDNMAVIQANIELMASDIEQINQSLDEAGLVLSQYHEAASNLQGNIAELKMQLPGWINTATWVVTIVLAWLAMTQIGLLSQGLEMIAKS